jgi:hypothetical protein
LTNNGPSGAGDFQSLCIIDLCILFLKVPRFDSVSQSCNWETETSVVGSTPSIHRERKIGLDHLQNRLNLLLQFIKWTSCSPKLKPCYYQITTITGHSKACFMIWINRILSQKEWKLVQQYSIVAYC